MDALCETCGLRRAIVHVTEVLRDGGAAERHLCDRCADIANQADSTSGAVERQLEALRRFRRSTAATSSSFMCQACHKVRGRIHLTERTPSGPVERQLCEACAAAAHHVSRRS